MIIAIALDNVITTYTQTFQEYMAQLLNIDEGDIEKYLPSDTSPDFSNWIKVNTDLYGHQVQAVSKGMLKTMGKANNVSEVLWKLNDENHHIRIVTSRFMKHGQNHKVVAHTAEWLDRNDIPYRDLLFIKNRTDVKADLYIEALPKNIIKFQELKQNQIVYTQPYNKDIKVPLRVNNWNEIYNLIK
jgi:5'(3')-deoxyribonucleotidase